MDVARSRLYFWRVNTLEVLLLTLLDIALQQDQASGQATHTSPCG